MSACFGDASCQFSSCLSVPKTGYPMEGAGADDVPIKKMPREESVYIMRDIYRRVFKNRPDFFVRVPGRVNLIGEHIDYCGFPALTMALEQDIVIAAGIIENKKINIRNVSDNFPVYTEALKNFKQLIIQPDSNGKHFWYNYILCGVKGALEYLDNKFDRGLDILVAGNFSPSSGLSNSSALVSASCLTFLHAQKVKVTKNAVASLCAASERYVGAQGGGIEQAIAFYAEKNSALHVTFLPLKVTPVYLPDNVKFVIANSMAEANKATKNDYNTRVVECRLAAKIIATLEEIESGAKLVTLSQLQECQDSTLEDMIALVYKNLPNDSYTKEEVCAILSITEKEVANLYLTPDTNDLNCFKLKQRALHVYEEAKRVEKFRKLCTESNFASDNIINTLGNLISESHESLKNLYECSHESVDLLVELSKKFGVSARLTGAGWGGCTVAICREEEVNGYINYITEEFYVKHFKMNREDVFSLIFATSPNDGAVIYQNRYI